MFVQMGQTDESERKLRKFFLRALAISLLIHVVGVGCWEVGQKRGWWKNDSLSAWLAKIEKKMLQSSSKPKPIFQIAKLPTQPQMRQVEIPLTFVDIDPAKVVEAPPKDAKFYGAANTLAASPVQKESDTPKIEGQQDKVMKTTEDSRPKAQPLQPAPPKNDSPKPQPQPVPKPEPKPEPQPQPKPQPKPEPKPVTKPEPQPESKPQPAQPEPKLARVPGDMTLGKPEEKPSNGKAATEQVKPKPQAVANTSTGAASNTSASASSPAQSRPRSLDDARRRAGIQGEKMKQDGGSRHVAMDTTLDVTRTASGDYDREFVDAVQQRWFKLLDERGATVPGKVVLEFRLHYDGRITDMKMSQNEVGELLGLICEKAVLDPAPYRRWPNEMRREINADYRDVRFTFFYLGH
jgi:outer membrane biosynthesis protein TonB